MGLPGRLSDPLCNMLVSQKDPSHLFVLTDHRSCPMQDCVRVSFAHLILACPIVEIRPTDLWALHPSITTLQLA